MTLATEEEFPEFKQRDRNLRCNFLAISSDLDRRSRILIFSSKTRWQFIHSAFSENTQSKFFMWGAWKSIVFRSYKSHQQLLKTFGELSRKSLIKKKNLEFHRTNRRICNHPWYCPLNGLKSNNMLWFVYKIYKFIMCKQNTLNILCCGLKVLMHWFFWLPRKVSNPRAVGVYLKVYNSH